MWREKYEENIRGGDVGWFLYTIWRFNSRGKEIFIVTMQGDGGVIEQCAGPFETLKSAQASLAGNIF
ncbi:transposase [bacterium]|nr:transposase [Verrucomicrobiota bacterium]MDA7632809.1 transposase [bacterium]MDA7680597.1 transposase [bacterium]